MTNAEFQNKLQAMYAQHPLIAKSEQKTLNELVYVLRMSGEDWQLNTEEKGNPNSFSCIPDVRETFIPVRDLAQKVVSVEFDEEIWEEYGIKLLVVIVED